VKTFRLRVTPGKAHAYVDLVKIPAANGAPAGVTIFDPSNTAHARLRKYAFLVDTGAESSLVTFADRDILTRAGFAGLPVIGIGGGCQPMGGGLLDFIFPGSRVRPLRATAVAWLNETPTHTRVGMARVDPAYGGEPDLVYPVAGEAKDGADAGPEGTRALSRRQSQGPPATPQMHADRFNIFGHEQLRDLG
jgi:hypothetical protein